ncbi:hypothetical protein [Streptomyces sp. SP18CS02]|uniref:hypothetical protein n=1 Tax=Streptomyces sp. SP18CS02 TaxID=3002531 RepID=UPI002E771521|nr:hypothetical protein [Streptomyces sp. SP18CS02]MEE1753210.1 hypothetical protein [Streptomyces sp. SP18CS02]
MSRRARELLTVTALSALLCAAAVAGTPTGTARASLVPRPAAPPARAVEVTRCAPGATLQGPRGQAAEVGVCVSGNDSVMSVTAPATCRRDGGRGHDTLCRTTGTWTARRDDGSVAAAGDLGGERAEYPGPGTYHFGVVVQVRSVGVDLRGRVRATLDFAERKAEPTHRVEVTPGTVAAGATTTLRYTVTRLSEQADPGARFGLTGEQGSGVELVSPDARCVNPPPGGQAAPVRGTHALDCALTDLRPGRPLTVLVRVTVKGACTGIVSKLGHWESGGQEFGARRVLAGPTVTCHKSSSISPGGRA